MTSTSSTPRADKRKAKPKPKARRGRGRPTRYTDALATEICIRLAEGESLRAICRDDTMPGLRTVMRWLFDGDHDDFWQQYARAREAQAEVWADEIVSIADDVSNDFTTGKDGKEIVDHENIQRSRLRIDARKWIASKLLPKRYGDKLQHTGKGGGPVKVEDVTLTEAARRIAFVLAKAAQGMAGSQQAHAPRQAGCALPQHNAAAGRNVRPS